MPECPICPTPTSSSVFDHIVGTAKELSRAAANAAT
jgi:hypothetical protein